MTRRGGQVSRSGFPRAGYHQTVKMEQPSHRRAIVAGQTSLTGHAGPFTGCIELERRIDGIYYTWRLIDAEGGELGLKGQFVSSGALPVGTDVFEHGLHHALESIKRYRVDRRRVHELLEWRWEENETVH